AHIPQYADGWPDIYHAYHPEMRTPEVLKDWSEMLRAPRQLAMSYGDLISFTLTTLSNARLAAEVEPDVYCVRGRIGGIKMLPELEHALMSMSPGDEEIVHIAYPPWEHENGWAYIMVKLIDIKPYGFQPIVADTVLRGVA
ncbi:unnamed protein product, partial [marine sediment metagenome]